MNALLDANVLFSIVLTDVLLSLAEDGLFVPLWTERILHEAESSLSAWYVDRGDHGLTSVRQRFRDMRDAFIEAMIDPDEYEHLVPLMRNHEDDRHVLAAAAAYRADALVTANVRHFPGHALAGLPIGEVLTPDAFLDGLHRRQSNRVEQTIDRLLSSKRRPPMTLHDFTARLEASGALSFAARLGATAGPHR